jgi:hypothetical protein
MVGALFINQVMKKYFYLCCMIGGLLFLSRCANPVSPTGGPKDIKPPQVLNCFPPNYSIHFKEDKIKIEFDEFIQIKDASKQVVISPPMLNNTDNKLRGKSLIVQFEDSLKLNTTYSINFGEAISDLAENNVLSNFTYVFSTGSYIDSLSYKGKIIDAFNLVPQKDVLVMLYMDDNDSIPFDSLPCKVKPYYLTRTNGNGEFYLQNLSAEPLKIFALKDMNNDYLYNLPDEKIGFLDSLVHGIYLPTVVADSLKQDSTEKQDSTIKKDSLKILPEIKTLTTLRIFQQSDSVQRLLKSALIQEGQVALFFRYPVKQPRFVPLNFSSTLDWKIEESNRRKDTLFLWLKNIPVDSLILQVTDKENIIDTVTFELIKKSDKDKRDKKEKSKIDRLQLSTNIQGLYFKQFRNELTVTSSYPLSHYSFSNILLVAEKDTLHPVIKLSDSVKRSFKIFYKWREGKKYRVIIPDSTLYSINNLTNDSLFINFQTKVEKDYGSLQLTVNIDSLPTHYIIQLLDEKENILEDKYLSASGKIRFDYLNPRTYKIKAILDKNNNGCWDTGDYFKKIQPEEVIYFSKQIEIRANWEVEETWNL